MKPEKNATKPIEQTVESESVKKGIDKNIECPQKEIDCPKSPVPDKFEVPTMPDDSYFQNVPKEQIELIDGVRTKDRNAASEKRADAVSMAEETYLTAQGVHEKAIREKESETNSLNRKSKNNKTELMRAYKEKLIGLLPQGCAVTNKDNSSIESRVPPDKLAVCIAELEKMLADEDIDYLKKLNEINLKFADAEQMWKKAGIEHEAAKCEARLVEEQERKQAEITWRTSLSQLVEKHK